MNLRNISKIYHHDIDVNLNVKKKKYPTQKDFSTEFDTLSIELVLVGHNQLFSVLGIVYYNCFCIKFFDSVHELLNTF